MKVISLHDFHIREFAFKYTADLDSLSRPVCFSTPDQLSNYLGTEGPNKAYVGGVYGRVFPRDKKLQAVVRAEEWVRRELVYDVDMDNYITARRHVCDCGSEKTVCNRCLELAKEAVIFLIDTLVEDFGLEKRDMITLFSGRQGFHLWVPTADKLFDNSIELPPLEAMRIETTIRSALAEYPVLVTEKRRKRESKGEIITEHVISTNYKSIPITLLKRMFNHVFKNLVLKSLDAAKEEIKDIKKEKWDELFKAMSNGSTGWEVWNNLINPTSGTGDSKNVVYTPGKIKKIQNEIIYLRYPRYDIVATKDVHRIMKIPGSVDGSTGNICEIVKDIHAFSLDNVANINNFIKEKKEL